ncbi:MAG: MCE family protein [Verrucomicrobia bacterium]|nr:MAG: MCE family protein [Verrucomicrobiota bacterium]
MRNTLETRLGIFFAIALVAAAVVLEMAGSFDTFRRGLRLQARFDNVLELQPGDPVKMAGKQIGRVETIEFADNKVLVGMKITDATAVIRTDSKATIRFSGLLGQNYVAIDFGSPEAPVAASGAELETVAQPDMSQILARIDGVARGVQKLTDNLSDVDLEQILVPFTDFLQSAGPDISTVLSNAVAITDQVRSGRGTVGRLIYDEALYASALETVTNLNQTAADIQATVDDARTLLADVKAGRGTVGKLVSDDTLYRETTEAMTQLKEIFQKINRGEGTAGRIVNDPSLIDNATLTLRKVDKATESLEDQGPLSVLSILINPLF